jgi:hypothetical protein
MAAAKQCRSTRASGEGVGRAVDGGVSSTFPVSSGAGRLWSGSAGTTRARAASGEGVGRAADYAVSSGFSSSGAGRLRSGSAGTT